MLDNVSIKAKLFCLIPFFILICVVIIILSYRTTIASVRNVAEEDLMSMITQFKLLITHDKDMAQDKEFISEICNRKIKIGKKGFIFIVDLDGKLYVHKKVQGENWSKKPHIKKILATKNGTLRYISPKTKTIKIASFQYCKILDKIIVASVFEDDLIGEVKNKILIIAIIQIVIIGAIVFIFLFFLINSIVSPINRITNILHKIMGKNEETLNLKYRTNITSTSEIGMVGKTFDTLIDRIQILVKHNNTNSKELHSFSTHQVKLISEIATSVEDMEHKSSTVSSSVETASVNMSNIATYAGDMSSSVFNVVTTIEEMSSTINEITRNCQKESEIVIVANAKAKSTNTMMKKLEVSANEIGKVLDIIKNVADQTNLLALNATIEAASAGDAGKGFAVVANEIKELAKKTAQATADIEKQIEEMYSNTNNSVKAITEITNVIEDVNQISQTIVSAIEEQSFTINEISKNISTISSATNESSQNVQLAAQELDTISKNTIDFAETINTITGNIEGIEKNTIKLTDIAKELSESVDKFTV